MAATAVAWTAGAASWLISTIPTDTAQRLAAWAEGLEQAATQHAIDFREASRESRQWLEAQRAALQENASEARAAADRAWQERAEARRTAQAASLQAVAARTKSDSRPGRGRRSRGLGKTGSRGRNVRPVRRELDMVASTAINRMGRIRPLGKGTTPPVELIMSRRRSFGRRPSGKSRGSCLVGSRGCPRVRN